MKKIEAQRFRGRLEPSETEKEALKRSVEELFYEFSVLCLKGNALGSAENRSLGEVIGKRIVFREAGKVEIEEFSLRKPEANEVLVETVCTLISPGTETAFLMALPNTPKRFPRYPGYSNVGVIASK